MSYKRHGFACALAALSLSASLVLSGCSGSSSGSDAASETEILTSGGSESVLSVAEGESLTGMVTAIDGNTLTIAAGMGGGQRPEGDMADGEAPTDGEAPSGMPESGQGGQGEGGPGGENSPDGEPPADRGDMSGEPPEAPDGGADMPGNGEPETQMVTMTTDVEVLLEENGEITTGTAADITVGSMVTLELEDGMAVRVTIQQMAAPDGAATE